MDGRGHNGSPFVDPTVAATMAAGLRQQQLPGGISGPHQQMIDTGSRAPADRRLLEQPWKDQRWLPITLDSVMHYFCQRENPFYDTSSDNAMAMMRNPGLSGPQLAEILKQMTGIQFVLVQPLSSAELFVIRKQQRMGPDKITPLCHYYILEGAVYQAPDMHTLLNSRLIGIMDPLRNALSETLEMLRFTPSKGYFWEFKTKPSKLTDDEKPEDLEPNYLHVSQQIQKEEKEEDPLSVRATSYQRHRTDMLLQQLANQFKSELMDIEIPSSRNAPSSTTTAVVNNTASTSQQHSKEQQHNNGAGASNATTGIVDFPGLLFGARPPAMPIASQSQQQSATQEQH